MAKQSKYYDVDGRSVPRVTSILNLIVKPQLPPWMVKVDVENLAKRIIEDDFWVVADLPEMVKAAKREHVRLRNEAAAIGTQFHAMAENYVRTRAIPDPESFSELPGEIQRMWPGFIRFMDDWKVQPIGEPESFVYDPHARRPYGGVLDLPALVTPPKKEKPRFVILDYKTSSEIWPIHLIQAAAYFYAYEISYPDAIKKHGPLKGCVIARFDKAGVEEIKYYPRGAMRHNYRIFKCYAEAWHLNNNGDSSGDEEE